MTDTWTWATVTQATPLRIKVDGDTTALDATTDNLVGSLAVDDRVRVHLHADGIIVTGIQGGGNRSNPNLLYNSDFMVNQEGYGSGGGLSAGDYGFDGWKATTTTSRMYFTPRAQAVEVAIVGSFAEVVERSKIWPGDPHTLSWTGDAQARVYNSGGTAPAYAPSPITVTLDGTADVLVEFDAGNLKWPKFERGAIATPYALPNYDDDLRECQRYFVRLNAPSRNDVVGWGHQKNTTTAQVISAVPVPMRATPTLTWAGTWTWSDRDTFNSEVSAFGTPTLVGTVLQFSATLPSSGVAYRPGHLLNNSSSVVAALYLDARL